MPEAIFQPQKFAILSYGIQTEFLAYIVLDDVIRVATLFFSERESKHFSCPKQGLSRFWTNEKFEMLKLKKLSRKFW